MKIIYHLHLKVNSKKFCNITKKYKVHHALKMNKKNNNYLCYKHTHEKNHFNLEEKNHTNQRKKKRERNNKPFANPLV